jgi:hypothetical protein
VLLPPPAGLTFEDVHVDHALVNGVGPGQSARVVKFTPYPGFKRNKDPLRGADFALLTLDRDLGGTTVELPELDCTKNLPELFECRSGIRHVPVNGQPEPNRSAELNSGIFDLFYNEPNDPRRPTIDSLLVDVRPLSGFSLIGDGQFDTALRGGDSGSGFYDVITGKLVGVAEAVRAPSGAPNVGRVAMVHKVCNPAGPARGWLNEELFLSEATADTADVPRVTFEQHVDSDRSKDLMKVTTVGPGSHALTIESTEAGTTVLFTEDISGMPELQSAASGNYTGTGRALMVVAEGTLVSAALDGPQPAVSGGPGAAYRMIATARMNADRIDDLVAEREDGQIDVFLGSGSGLQFNGAIQAVPMRLDGDSLADFMWVDGDAGIHTWSSMFGRTFRDLIPNTIDLDAGTAGRFRRVVGDENGDGRDDSGMEDIVVIGDEFVLWCHSTGGGGVSCDHPALEAPSAGRGAADIEVEDLTRDGLDDLTVFYSNSPPRVFVGQNDGFSSSFGYGVRAVAAADLDGNNIPDTVTFDDPGGEIELEIRLNPEGSGDLGPIATGIPFTEPFQIVVGNLNDDGVPAPSALETGFVPLQDVVVLSGGVVFAVLSNGDGTVDIDELDGEDGFVSVEVFDVNGDGIDDIEGTKDDGSVTVYAGGTGGVDPVGANFTGLPTPDSNDGKMLLLSGLGVDTVGATEARLRVRIGPEDTAALANLNVQVFDGDNGGLHQFEEQTNLLKTCYRLTTDPCGDGNQGSCSGGPTTPVHLVTVSSDGLGDDVWDTIYDGPNAPEASFTGNGQPPFTYELRVYLSEDCSQLPAVGSTVSVATADAFKVRSNALLSQPLGEFSLIGSDSSGDFGVPGLPYLRNTDFDGSFSLPIAVGASAAEVQLKETDADDSDDATPGVSLGSNSEIQYRLVRPDGSDASLVGAEDTSPASVVDNPSGNNDGVADFDVETRTHTISTPMPGIWQWQWENVLATNAVHVFAPFGSPTAHEVLGARRALPKLTTVQQPGVWQSDAGALIEQLPLILGRELEPGVLEGRSIVVSTHAQAQLILGNASQTLEGELERQLLLAKLNWQRGLVQGEDIKGAFVYGRTVTVNNVLRRADDLVAGFDLLTDDDGVADLVDLLSSINLGEITYQHPGVPFPEQPMADDDNDGILNLKDNCPSVVNPLQEDSDDDRIGDACHVSPRACVLEQGDGSLRAFLGYENPLSFRALAAGSRNQVLVNGVPDFDAAQPTEFSNGLRANVFNRLIGAADAIAWTLDGETVIASAAAERCSGRELARLDFAPQTALFGSEAVVLGEYTSVAAEGELASVVSGGDLLVGASSVVGHLLAGTSARVDAQGSVLGVALTGGTVTTDASAAVRQVKHGAVRSHALDWAVGFAGAASNVVVEARASKALPPGEYGDVVVHAQAQLGLQQGTYRFRSLNVYEQGSLLLEGGDVVVHVATALSHVGETRAAQGSSAVIGYFGTEPATIASSLRATLIAPHAEVSLGTVPNSVYIGAFFAKRLSVLPRTLVHFAER